MQLLITLAASSALLFSQATAVGVEGLLGASCTGEPLFGYDFDGASGCIDVSGYRQSTSIAVNNFIKDQQVNFFDDTECKVIRYTAASPVCYAEQDGAKTQSIAVSCNEC